MEEDRKFCLYRIMTNGMQYIGVSCEVDTRVKNHSKYDDRKGRTMRKYGYSHEVLVGSLTYEEAYDLEKLTVDSNFLSRPDVLNVAEGGVGGFFHINEAFKNGELAHWTKKEGSEGFREKQVEFFKNYNESRRKSGEDKKFGSWLAQAHGKKVLNKINKIAHLCPHCGREGKGPRFRKEHFVTQKWCK